MNSKEKALAKKKGGKVLNLVKGFEGKVDDKGKKPEKVKGAKNNDSQED